MNKFETFKKKFTTWSINHDLIEGACIIGSYARGTQKPNSDIDTIIFTKNPNIFIKDKEWVNTFGKTKRILIEQWSKVTILRCFYFSGMEIEFGISTIDWTTVPVDKGTYRIVADGLIILHDPTGKINKLIQEIKN